MENGCPHMIVFLRGRYDGLKFVGTECEMSDGTIRLLYKSDSASGFYKMVFVPFDREYPDMIERPNIK